jgi:inhibitor of KinA sporulation pathway (predicted exonuclease)
VEHIVIDLEMNPVSKKNKAVRRYLSREVIEVGAVKFDDSYAVIDRFRCYVKPRYNQIEWFIQQLTGIADKNVQGGEDFVAVMARFCEWVGTEEFVLYSWSDQDLQQLQRECRMKLADCTETDRMWDHWVDLQAQFGEKLGVRHLISLKDALGAAEVPFLGTQHTALDDAANTSYLLQLMQNPVAFRKQMQPVLDLFKEEVCCSSIGELCPQLLAYTCA